jgi:hypothetical protein
MSLRTTARNYCTSLWFFIPALRGTSVSKLELKSPKVILRSGVSGVPVRHFAKLIMFKSKVAAEWGEASLDTTHAVDAPAPKHAPPSKLKRRRAIRRAHIADMGFLSEQITKKKSAEPVTVQTWLWGILMALPVALAKVGSGLSKACMLRKWVLRAAVMWMAVQATAGSPIDAAVSPVPMPFVTFGSLGVLESPAESGHRRILSKVATNWGELMNLCQAGGNEVALSDSFDASSYPGQITFSRKMCVVKARAKPWTPKGLGASFMERVLVRCWKSMAWSSRTALGKAHLHKKVTNVSLQKFSFQLWKKKN